MRLNTVFVYFCALLFTTFQAFAEKKPMLIGQNTVIQATVIVDTLLSAETSQVVLNPGVSNLADQSDMLPEYCLLNASAIFDSGQFYLEPGTLVCVSDDKRILEGIVQGSFEGVETCEGCSQVKLLAGSQFILSLDTDLQLSLQIRADGQAQ